MKYLNFHHAPKQFYSYIINSPEEYELSRILPSRMQRLVPVSRVGIANIIEDEIQHQLSKENTHS